jgi:tetratricopeptide (TPR) repeat protein
MSEPLRTDDSRALAAASEADRNAKIEQLLLAGLDHYFAGQYDHAISVWTRVLFLDRSHARARAYIERARSALAERQRESEELLQRGLAAFQRGDGNEARQLVQAAIATGAPTDEALALLTRLDRLESTLVAKPAARQRAQHRERPPVAPATHWFTITLMVVATLAAAGVYSVAVWGPVDWRSALATYEAPAQSVAPSPVRALPVPRRAEQALARARGLAANGQLHDALTALELVRPTDTQRAEADRLRGEIQLQLIALTAVPSQPATVAPAAGPVDRPDQ